MKLSKRVISFLILILVDFIIIWFWVKAMNPDQSVTIYLIFLIPTIIAVNLMIAVILFILKKNHYSTFFLINSILSSIIMYFVFIYGMERNYNERYTDWKFNKSDTLFYITQNKKDTLIDISFKLNDPHTSYFILSENYNSTKDGIAFHNDSINCQIIDNKLIGFRNKKDTIKLNKK